MIARDLREFVKYRRSVSLFLLEGWRKQKGKGAEKEMEIGESFRW